MINRQGCRFVDEGEDANLFTYAKFGRAILAQPGAKAWQIFDQQVVHLLEPRYSTSKPITADTLEELVGQLDIDNKDAGDPDAARVQRRGARRGRGLRSDQEGRRVDARADAGEDQLGHQADEAAVLRLQRDRRDHLHLRRREGERDGRR